MSAYYVANKKDNGKVRQGHGKDKDDGYYLALFNMKLMYYKEQVHLLKRADIWQKINFKALYHQSYLVRTTETS